MAGLVDDLTKAFPDAGGAIATLHTNPASIASYSGGRAVHHIPLHGRRAGQHRSPRRMEMLDALHLVTTAILAQQAVKALRRIVHNGFGTIDDQSPSTTELVSGLLPAVSMAQLPTNTAWILDVPVLLAWVMRVSVMIIKPLL